MKKLKSYICFFIIGLLATFGASTIAYAQITDANNGDANLVQVKSDISNAQEVNNNKSPWSFILYRLNLTLVILGGIFCIYFGYKLFILGVTGKASLSLESKELKGQLINASPGLFFAIGGIIIVAIAATRM